MTGDSHECNKLFCANCKQKRNVGHLCFIRHLKDVLSSAGDKVLYVFYKTTQNTRYSKKATFLVPDLVCLQQFCSQCEDVEDGDCVRCGKRKHSFWDDPVGDILSYECQPRPWAKTIIAIAHNVKAFDLHFILIRAIMLNGSLIRL